MKYCDVVILDIVSPDMEQRFTYRIPKHWQRAILPGMVVKVPFGPRRLLGVVSALVDKPDLDPDKIKPLYQLLLEKPAFNEELFLLAEWIKGYYACSFSKVLNKMLPRGLKLGIKPVYVTEIKLDSNIESLEEVNLPPQAVTQKKALEALLEKPDWRIQDLKEKIGCSYNPLYSLIKKGIAHLERTRIYREPIQFKALQPYAPKSPTQEQDAVLKLIRKQMANLGEKLPILIFGVTGSGKTEIYLQIIAEYLEKGLDVIVLIPEISLTPQTISRFGGRFGEQVAIIHSRLSVGERMDQWEKILRGDAKVVIGPRSAVFAPCQNLGLIIIDEEHENSYKQEEDPKYHAREVAQKRAKLTGAQLILGSATPSTESMYRVDQGEFILTKLKERIASNRLPSINIVNMKAELEKGNRSIFSRELLEQIKTVTDAGKQVILFLNRRGFSTFFLCRTCGFTIQCPRCEVTLTYHKSTAQLMCHYCDYIEPPVQVCPNCLSSKIRGFGAGTQRIQDELNKFYPWMTAIRMDVDTTRRKNAHQELLNRFQKKEAQVLIGTQMIAKGLDFPEVSLVGVISADTSLHLPDFRAGEKTFQLLTQVAGRAGREKGSTGQVIVQTYNPTHYSIKAVEQEDAHYFLQKELEMRAKLKYPPYSRLIRILLRAQKPEKLSREAEILEQCLMKMGYEILGPNPCPIEKIKDDYRWHLLIRQEIGDNCLDKYDEALLDFLRQKKYHLFEQKEIKMAVDVDPLNLL